jgi:CBS-domain-containing membrane protein
MSGSICFLVCLAPFAGAVALGIAIAGRRLTPEGVRWWIAVAPMFLLLAAAVYVQ